MALKALNGQRTTKQLDGFVLALTKLPGVIVNKTDRIVTIKSQSGKTALSAISDNGRLWSIRTDPRLFPAADFWSGEEAPHIPDHKWSSSN